MSFDFDAAVLAPFRMQPGLGRMAERALHLTPGSARSRPQLRQIACRSLADVRSALLAWQAARAA